MMADASEEFRRLFAGALAEESDLELVGETGDGADTTRLVQETEPDVLVMDLVLARMDGLEVLGELAELEKRPKVLIMSGFARGNMAELAASAGADYYMMKPCRMSALMERIRQMAGGEGEEKGRSIREENLESTVTSIILVMTVLPQLLMLGDALIERTAITLNRDRKQRFNQGTMRLDGHVRGHVSGFVDGEFKGVLHGSVDALIESKYQELDTSEEEEHTP